MKLIIYLLLFELDQIEKIRIIGLIVTNQMQKLHQLFQVTFEKTTKMGKKSEHFF
jgi:hypothetical protein